MSRSTDPEGRGDDRDGDGEHADLEARVEAALRRVRDPEQDVDVFEAGLVERIRAEDGAFESRLSSEQGFTFEHAFEDGGTTKYVCRPHESLGMKGVVAVE